MALVYTLDRIAPVAMTCRTLLKTFRLQRLHIDWPSLWLINVTQLQAVSLNQAAQVWQAKNTLRVHDGVCAASDATHGQRMLTFPEGITGVIAGHRVCVCVCDLRSWRAGV